MKLIKFILILLVLTILLITFVPLNLYYKNISKELKPIQLEQISGSLIKGSAQNLQYMGINLGQVIWTLYPSSYDTISLNWSVKDKLYDLTGIFNQSTKSKKIDNLRGTFDWEILNKYIKINYSKISGYVKLDFATIEFKNNTPERIVGKAITKDLRLLKPINKNLGEIEVVFTSDNPVIIVGQVNSKSSLINVSGAIYIYKDRRWEVKLTLLPMPGEYEIEYAIQNIGDRRSGGGRSLNLAGFY